MSQLQTINADDKPLVPLSRRTQTDGRTTGRASFRALLEVPTRPFQYPSLQHLDDAIEAAVQRHLVLRRVRERTARWVRDSYRLFRRFLTENSADVRFLSGDLAQQVAILEDWVASMTRRGLQRGAVNAVWRGLASAFRWLTRSDTVVNPLLFIDPPKAGRRAPRFLSKSAAEQVLTHVAHRQWSSDFERDRNTAIIGVMLLAGLRRGEVIRLRTGDVDLERRAIFVHDAKGPDGGRDRTAYMPPQLAAMVSRYVEQRRKHPTASHEHLFVTAQGGTRISVGVIERVCRILTRETGIRVAPHLLRHSYATLLRQAGIADRVAMELLGHADLRMLMRYSHVEAEEPRAAAARLTFNL